MLAGPTGVGKTQLAIELCRRFGGEIVGADSVQVYRGFDIGSGKPSAEELRGVRASPARRASSRPRRSTRRASRRSPTRRSRDVAARGRVPIVVGGTGLWLRALLRGLVERAGGRSRAARASSNRSGDDAGARGAARTRCAQVDPRSAARVHPSDKLRVVRALEVHAQTGRALGELRAAARARRAALPRADARARPAARALAGGDRRARARHVRARFRRRGARRCVERYGAGDQAAARGRLPPGRRRLCTRAGPSAETRGAGGARDAPVRQAPAQLVPHRAERRPARSRRRSARERRVADRIAAHLAAR